MGNRRNQVKQPFSGEDLCGLVTEIQRLQEGEKLLKEIHTMLNLDGKLPIELQIRFDNFVGYDDSE